MPVLVPLLAGAATAAGGALVGSALGGGSRAANGAAQRAQYMTTDISGGANGNPLVTQGYNQFGGLEIGGVPNQFDAQTALTSGSTNSLNRFNALQNSLYGQNGQFQGPQAALDPSTGEALLGAQTAFGPDRLPPTFFGGNQSQFQNQGQQAVQGAQAGGFNLFQQLGQNGDAAYSDALGRGFTGASADALGALQNFDPQAYAAQAKAQLDALAAPGETTQTQRLFNGLQSSGRLGITQNGELGDIGGLQLAQETANNQRALQAAQLGQQAQAQLVNNAGALGQSSQQQFAGGSNLRQGAANLFSGLQSTAQQADLFGFNRLLGQNNLSQNNALTRFQIAGQGLGLANSQLANLQGLGTAGVQQSLAVDAGRINAINSSVNASAVRAGAQSNAGTIAVAGANNAANNYGSLFSGLAPSVGKFVGGALQNTFGGGGFVDSGQYGSGSIDPNSIPLPGAA